MYPFKCLKESFQMRFFSNNKWWIKGALDKFNIIPNIFPKKVGIFIPLEVLALVKTACRVLHSRLTYFWRNMNISSIFYFSKSTSKNTQYSSLWGHSEDDAVHKIAHKMKMHRQNQLKFSVLVRFQILYRTRYKKIDVILVQCPFKSINPHSLL